MGILNNIMDRFKNAEFTVAPQKKLKTISAEFREAFGLTLVFYKGAQIADGDLTLAALNKKTTKDVKTDAGALKIKASMKVGDAEKLFDSHFGVTVQIKDKSGKTHTFAPGGTDFEYVHIPVTPKGTNVWSGGNHGNEAFISIDFYNAETGAKLDFTAEGDELSLKPAKKYTIKYTFSLNTNMQGAYLSSYDLKNPETGKTEKEYLVSTQFESHYARECFPCIDEPAAKATFDLKIITPDTEDTITFFTDVFFIIRNGGNFCFDKVCKKKYCLWSCNNNLPINVIDEFYFGIIIWILF